MGAVKANVHFNTYKIDLKLNVQMAQLRKLAFPNAYWIPDYAQDKIHIKYF